MLADPFALERFVLAQDTGGTFSRALAELKRARKTTHWMCSRTCWSATSGGEQTQPAKAFV